MNRNENAIGRKRNQKQLASFTNFTVGPVSFDGSEGEKTKKKNAATTTTTTKEAILSRLFVVPLILVNE